eukprot:TRINITY_DN538_c1_g1_i1.p1 TRINITY_DN538_c1_g1~~TRINITY_DN538_c1_g1_i1.p1  ORF type:complete len:423 (-),score=123.10 TRINITY_DN538_c1_g1_i1:218-1303(-)
MRYVASKTTTTTSQNSERHSLIISIIKTVSMLSDDINLILNEFYYPLEEKKVLTDKQDLLSIFGNILKLSKVVNKRLLDPLRNYLIHHQQDNQLDNIIGVCFSRLEKLWNNLELYNSYHLQSKKGIEHAMTSPNKLTVTLLKKYKLSPNSLSRPKTLHEVLGLPITMGARLVADLLSLVEITNDVSHPDYKPLQKLRDEIKRCVVSITNVDDSTGDDDTDDRSEFQTTKAWQAYTVEIPKEVNLDLFAEHRKPTKSCRVQHIVSIKKTVKMCDAALFLFNDLVLLANIVKKRLEKFVYQDHFYLPNCKIYDTTHTSGIPSLEIIEESAGKKSATISFKDKPEKDEWLSIIQSQIDSTKTHH